MDGLFFLSSLGAMGLLLAWLILNDRAGPTEPTIGFFAMDDETPAKPPAGQAPRPSRPL